MGKTHIKGGRTLRPVLLFHPGTFGNFLTRCLSIAAGKYQPFNMWEGRPGGAHAFPSDSGSGWRSGRIVDHCHTWELTHNDVFIYIDISEEYTYVIHCHDFRASDDLGLDLLDDTDIRERIKQVALNNPPDSKRHVEIVDFYNNLLMYEDSTYGLIEHYKNQIRVRVDRLLGRRVGVVENNNIKHIVQYRDLYDKEYFVNLIKNAVIELGFSYVNDISDYHDKLMQNMEKLVTSNNRILEAFDHYKNKQPYSLTHLSLYEHAYLYYLIEKDIGKDIELCYPNGYYSNISDIGNLL